MSMFLTTDQIGFTMKSEKQYYNLMKKFVTNMDGTKWYNVKSGYYFTVSIDDMNTDNLGLTVIDIDCSDGWTRTMVIKNLIFDIYRDNIESDSYESHKIKSEIKDFNLI